MVEILEKILRRRNPNSRKYRHGSPGNNSSVCQFAGSGIKLGPMYIPSTAEEPTCQADEQPTRNESVLPYYDPSNIARH